MQMGRFRNEIAISTKATTRNRIWIPGFSGQMGMAMIISLKVYPIQARDLMKKGAEIPGILNK